VDYLRYVHHADAKILLAIFSTFQVTDIEGLYGAIKKYFIETENHVEKLTKKLHTTESKVSTILDRLEDYEPDYVRSQTRKTQSKNSNKPFSTKAYYDDPEDSQDYWNRLHNREEQKCAYRSKANKPVEKTTSKSANDTKTSAPAVKPKAKAKRKKNSSRKDSDSNSVQSKLQKDEPGEADLREHLIRLNSTQASTGSTMDSIQQPSDILSDSDDPVANLKITIRNDTSTPVKKQKTDKRRSSIQKLPNYQDTPVSDACSSSGTAPRNEQPDTTPETPKKKVRRLLVRRKLSTAATPEAASKSDLQPPEPVISTKSKMSNPVPLKKEPLEKIDSGITDDKIEEDEVKKQKRQQRFLNDVVIII